MDPRAPRRDDHPPGTLEPVRAAQLRAQARRWAIGKIALGTVFLIGAFAYAVGPEAPVGVNIGWMVLLVVLSSTYVGLGLRALSRVHGRGGRLWLPAAVCWGLLAAMVLQVLSRR